MPAKKKTKKAAGKKAVAGKKTRKAAKKAVKKKTAKKAVKKKAVKKKAAKKPVAPKIGKKVAKKPEVKEKPETIRPMEPPPPPPPPPKPKQKLGIDCEHCDATGVCAAGTPYDKSHGQMFGAKVRVTSCIDCLLAAGEHKNSKKLVSCRVCDGDGKV
jgi:hypothetical protein